MEKPPFLLNNSKGLTKFFYSKYFWVKFNIHPNEYFEIFKDIAYY